jgi:hypothetical protein
LAEEGLEMTAYDPVADYMRQRPNSKRPRGEELRLLKTLSKLEVDALVSIDNKGRNIHGEGMVPMHIGANSY